MDVSKLTPAPWFIGGKLYLNRYPRAVEAVPTDYEFVNLARNAFDVMLRRHWHAEYEPVSRTWIVSEFDWLAAPQLSWPDPFTALVEADKWYSANVEPCANSPQP